MNTPRWLLLCALASGVALALPAIGAAQDPTGQARALFEQGVAASDAGDHVRAAQYFEQSYRLYPRASTACNMALALENSQRACGAPAWYRQCAALDRDGRFRDHAQRQAAALEAQCQQQQQPTQAANPFVSGPIAPTGPASGGGGAVSGRATVVEGGGVANPQALRTRGADHTLLAVGIISMVLGGGAIGGGATAAIEGQARLEGLPPVITEGSNEHDRWSEAATLHDLALGLYIGGGALALFGAIMVIVDLAQPGALGGSAEAPPRLQLGVTPTEGGAFGQASIRF